MFTVAPWIREYFLNFNSSLVMADLFWVLKIIMGLNAKICTVNQTKELLQIHENTLLNVFNSTIARLDKKIDIAKEENSKIKKELTDLRENVQYHSDNVYEINKNLDDIYKWVEDTKLDEINEDFVRKTKKKLADLKLEDWFRPQSSKQFTFSWVSRRNQ